MRREFPKAPIVGVGAVVLDGSRVLLVRRGHEPMKGEWSIPGGVLELGETLESGIRREVAEETGLEVKILALVNVLDRIVADDSTDSLDTAVTAAKIRYHYVLIDFLCVPVGGTLVAGSDAVDSRWVERAELISSGEYPLVPITVAVIEKAFTMSEGVST